MSVTPLLLAATGASVVTATASNAAGGPDYIGIAAIITAVSGLVGTIGMLALAAFRRRTDVPLTPEQIADAVKRGLEE